MRKGKNMQVDFSKSFCKDYKKAPKKIKETIKERLSLFKINKYEKILNNHQLSGDLSFLRSINITGDWRALFVNNDDKATFIILDRHSNLYK
jgi:addiction module RelE/StbE family toxin